MSRDLKYTTQKNLELEKEYLKLAFKLRCNSFFYKVKGLHQIIHIACVKLPLIVNINFTRGGNSNGMKAPSAKVHLPPPLLA